MPGQARFLDITFGWCKPVPPPPRRKWIGIWIITKSPNHITNNFGSIRRFDMEFHKCSHGYKIGLAMFGSPNTFINNQPSHRHILDIIVSLCKGLGFTISGSKNSIVNNF